MSPTRVSPRTCGQAHALRRNATLTERRLWHALKLVHISSSQFRRKVPIGVFIADFACHRTKHIIELDGGQHTDDEAICYDEARTAWHGSQGFRVLRFQNPDVIHNLDGVVDLIKEALWELEAG